ncbi:MAG: glycoside hydrolase family 2 TIM barrel-domain containing protein, partial [Oscillospiraceae bacterium]
IWQTVWLEAKSQLHLESVQITPDIDERCIHLETSLAGCFTESLHLDCQVSLNGRQVAHAVFSLPKSQTRQTLCFPEESALDNLHYWTPESPVLYDIQLTLLQDALALDTVSSYFGMRKIEVRDNMILLNNNVLFQRLCLDQGYWEDTLLTAPDDEALRQDILLAKQAGFNGVRSHQKIEEARFYYWADKLGFLVWGELPSAYEFCTKEEENLYRDLTAMIRRDYNHPSIITWVPLNESWGVRNILTDRRQQDFASSLYYLCKALDPSRLVSTNDGWEMVASCDFYGVHDYAPYAKDLTDNYASLTRLMASRASSRLLYAQGQPSCTEKPVLITEYGGISFTDPNHPENWGYNGLVQNEKEFLARYADITRGFCALPYCWGYCYTQLTDVFQEANGLLRMDRTWKVDPQRLREINLSCGAK